MRGFGSAVARLTSAQTSMPRSLPRSLIEAWEGAALRGKVTRSRDPVRPVRSGHDPRTSPLSVVVSHIMTAARLINRRLVI